MKESDFLALMREALDLGVEASLDMSMPLDTLSTWDSMSKISFMASLSVRHNINISAAKVRSCVTMEDLYKLALSA